MFINIRQTNILIFLGCVGLILTALVMQYQFELKPCPLCITQRVFVIVTGLLALIAALHNPAVFGRRIYALVGIIASGIGGGVSLRHMWLQSLPEDLVPACGPGLSYMFENFPLSQAINLLLQGDGNCADTVFSLFGLSIPGWTAVAYMGLILFNLWQLVRRESR
jgi:disulfide bond formation protein DsbB